MSTFIFNKHIIWYLFSSIFNYATFIHIERHLIPVLHWLYFLFFLCIYLSQMSFFLSLCNQFGVICNVKLIRLYLKGWQVCENMHNRWRSVIVFREHQYTTFWKYLISRKLRYYIQNTTNFWKFSHLAFNDLIFGRLHGKWRHQACKYQNLCFGTQQLFIVHFWLKFEFESKMFREEIIRSWQRFYLYMIMLPWSWTQKVGLCIIFIH